MQFANGIKGQNDASNASISYSLTEDCMINYAPPIVGVFLRNGSKYSNALRKRKNHHQLAYVHMSFISSKTLPITRELLKENVPNGSDNPSKTFMYLKLVVA